MITEPMNTKLLETIAAIIKIMASMANIQSILYPFIIMSTPYHLKSPIPTNTVNQLAVLL